MLYIHRYHSTTNEKWKKKTTHTEREERMKMNEKKTKNHYSLKTNLPPKKATVKLIRRMFG